MSNLGIIALTCTVGPESSLDPSIAIAASRAGAIGVINAEFVDDPQLVLESLRRACDNTAGTLGIRCSAGQTDKLTEVFEVLKAGSERNIVIVSPTGGDLASAIKTVQEKGLKVLVETISLQEALNAQLSGANAVIAKGNEAGGRIGEETTFVLLQRLIGKLSVPVIAYGGIGLNTTAACHVAGATGIVLDSQLLLSKESPLPAGVRAAICRLDGTETAVLGGALSRKFKESWRFAANPSSRQIRALNEDLAALESKLENIGDKPEPEAKLREQFHELIKKHVAGQTGAANFNDMVALFGQDVCFAHSLAGRYVSVAGIIQAIKNSVEDHLDALFDENILSADAPLARSHGTKFPIVQGAMTRVSDCADLTLKVAENGALSFLAMALLRKDDCDKLLSETKKKLGSLPWGVGILGFVPKQLREEQLEVIKEYRPPFALIAGGRPDQAKALEQEGIKTYLHVPSPFLLESFIESGARRFIFEGKECGGHVGPRSSFVLWESMLEVLDAATQGKDASEFHILFAGGIHDSLSAAMVAAMAAPLAKRGVRTGVLMGTAYLFTREAVESKAIVRKFQDAALKCDETVLFETGPGHAIRCIESPYRETFDNHRKNLEAENVNRDQIRQELELMNLGRLRIASKGITRGVNAKTGSRELVSLPDEKQWSEGMYMVGQVASMHDRVLSIEELHSDVAYGSFEHIQELKSRTEISGLAAEPGRDAQEKLAVIGMASFFPQASDLDEYWHNILSKIDAITEVPEQFWNVENLYDPDRTARDKIYSKWGGFLKEIAFNPTRYGIPPSSVPYIDPMQLLLLEASRKALADAGYRTVLPTSGRSGNGRILPKDKTSVLLATSGHGPITSSYLLRSMFDWKLSELDEETKEQLKSELPEWTEDTFPGLLGNVAGGRISNRFDFGGINFSIDAACASSLAALYVGMADLRSRRSDVVVLTAADTHNQPVDYLSFSKTQALSPRGRCRTFDATADGIVISEGVAAVILKRLEDAERDGDHIYATIAGIGGSSDGRALSLTAPRKQGQVAALNRAYADAGISPASIELVEAHGTGTVAGDKAEIESLHEVFAASGSEPQSCAVGSVKTMIGHTKAAAGIASLIKVAKALHHKVIPPTIGVDTPNPSCNFEDGPFYLATEPKPWFKSRRNSGIPRRAGVSAFGFGGTNFHAVLEEYTGISPLNTSRQAKIWPAELFVFTGSNVDELNRSVSSFAKRVEQLIDDCPASNLAPSLGYLAYNLHLKNCENNLKDRTRKLAVVATSLDDLKRKLASAADALTSKGETSLKDPRGIYFNPASTLADGKLAFLFPGQGSQRLNMLSDLGLYFEEIRKAFASADRHLFDRLGSSLTDFIFPPASFNPEDLAAKKKKLTNTRIAQPALAAADTGLLAVAEELGLAADMVAGHSFGEYVALAAGGAISTKDLNSISEIRGRLLAETNGSAEGTMAAVSTDENTLKDLLSDLPGVVIANVNAPKQCVIAGTVEAVESAIQTLSTKGIKSQRIPVSAAFHSPHMEEAKSALESEIRKLNIKQPEITVYSNNDAVPYPADPEKIKQRLSSHLVRPVNFVKEIQAMYEDGARIFIEIGPGSVLSNLVDLTLADREHLAVSTDRAGRNGMLHLMHTLAELISHGVDVNTAKLFRHRFGQLSDIECALQVFESDRGKPRLRYFVNGTQTWSEKEQRPVNKGTGKTGSMAKKTTQAPAAAAAVQQSTPVHPALAGANKNGNNGARTASQAISSASSVKAPQGSSRKDQVMIEFQRSMLQMTNSFLETQEKVMLAYLNGSNLPGAAAPDMTKVQVPELLSSLNEAIPEPGNNGNGSGSQAVAGTHAAGSDTAPAATPEPAGDGSVDPEFLIENLMEIVAERTGYPPEMLDPTLDMEADLGIDSIKRIEILSSFRKLIPESKQTDIEANMEQLAGIKTLQGIIDWIRTDFASGKAASTPKAPSAQAPAKQVDKPKTVRPGATIQRGLVKAADFPIEQKEEFACPGIVLITDDQRGIATSIAASLKERGVTAAVIRHGQDALTTSAGVPVISTDLLSSESIESVLARLRSQYGSIDGLIHLSALKTVETNGSAPDDTAVRSFFCLLKALEKDLNASARPSERSKSVVLTATQMGGDFGISTQSNPDSSRPDVDTVQPALVGILKSLSHEWPDTFCRTVDFSADAEPEKMAELILNELDSPVVMQAGYNRQRTEAGYFKGKRIGLEVVARELQDVISGSPAQGDLELSKESVVLVTGGARGITAEIALELAENYQPRLVILGRTAQPSADEDPAFAGLSTAREVKGAIIESLKKEGKSVSVSTVEPIYQKVMRDREIRANLDRMRKAGSDVHYVSADVTDMDGFGQMIDRIYDLHGSIDGVIHGAGVIEDAYIKDKSQESFDRVFNTKVIGAQTLLRHLQLDSLKFFFLFSSVVGRTGNAGQSDYVAANEVVNKLACRLNSRFDCRVASLMWGPWNGGMAQPELEETFASHGWSMIDPAAGRKTFMKELLHGKAEDAEVLLVGILAENEKPPESNPSTTVSQPEESACATGSDSTSIKPVMRLHESRISKPEPGRVIFSLGLDIAKDIYLQDHKFDNIPVLPMAMALELMAEAASSVYPGYKIVEIENMNIPAGLVVEGGKKDIHLQVSEEDRSSGRIRVATGLMTGAGATKPHFRTTLSLAESSTESADQASFEFPPIQSPETNLPSVKDIYTNWLFHGPIFQGMISVDEMGLTGITGRVMSSKVEDCIVIPEYNPEWLVDPVLLDSSMQLAGVWARHYLDITVLPTGFTSLKQFAAPSGQPLVATVHVPVKNNLELKCDLSIREEDGNLVMFIKGLGGVGSKNFNRFAKQPSTLRTV